MVTCVYRICACWHHGCTTQQNALPRESFLLGSVLVGLAEGRDGVRDRGVWQTLELGGHESTAIPPGVRPQPCPVIVGWPCRRLRAEFRTDGRESVVKQHFVEGVVSGGARRCAIFERNLL